MSREWKDTLLMPQTKFEMKANLIEKEKVYRKFWEENKIYEKALKKAEGYPEFRLLDGPPYANGSLHVGHALNKILKDIIVRDRTLRGFRTPFTYGWDTHGLPIENKMLSEMKMTKDDMDPLQLRIEAAKYAKSQVAVQANQFESMQLFAPLKNRYLTLDKKYETNQLKLFKKMALDGLIYKGLKPVYWSPSSQTALAEAEVEYQDHMSPQVIVSFKVNKGNDVLAAGDNLLIMTTTPWTLIANSGVAVGESFDYSILEVKGQKFVVASLLVESVAKLAKWEEFKELKVVKGSQLIGLEYTRPIKRELSAPVISGHHVTTEAGTGLVHMAPLFGEDDFIIGKQKGLEMIMHVDEKGDFNSEAGIYEGMFYANANKDIGMFLDEKGELLSLKFLKHSYPHDWRTHKPVIYRGTPQWFVSIDKIKEKIQAQLKGVTSYPDWAVNRLSKMIDGRSDWTISRQRTWGVPIIVFYDKDNNPIIKEELFDYVINLVSEKGTNVWWELDTEELLPESHRNKGYTREMNIMDVWFDSGSSFLTPQTEGDMLEMKDEIDVYFEGSDQYRGWFNSSLINSVAYNGKAPYKTLISHGFVLDGKQQKMSKSKGNVIDPLKVINQKGADVLRLWAANSEYSSDVTISEEILKQNVEIYRRIRNSVRFMLGNLFDFTEDNFVEYKGIHLWFSQKIIELKKNVKKAYTDFKFINVVKEVNKFLIQASGFYFDYNKDHLYVEKKDDYDRRATQSNLFKLVDFIINAMAPILPTTMEEAYQLFNKKDKKESIMLHSRPFSCTDGFKPEILEEYKDFLKTRDESLRTLEKARKEGIIKRNNEAVLYIPSELLNQYPDLDFANLLMVAKVIEGTEFKVESFDSVKCKRCWNHFDAGTLTNEEICQRCHKVIS